MSEVAAKVSVLHFQVAEPYCERALENLLEIIEGRGATYKQMEHDGSWYEVIIPETLSWVPFYSTISNASEAVKRVERSVEHATVVYNCEYYED